MSTRFRELPGSPVEVYDATGIRAQRRLVCAWDQRRELVAQLLGNPLALGGVEAAAYPGIEGLVAVQARVEPVTDETLGPIRMDVAGELGVGAQFALVSADYELLGTAAAPTSTASTLAELAAASPGTFVAGAIQPDVERLPVLRSGVRWQSVPDQAVPEDLTLLLRVPVLVHRCQWRRVAEPPLAAIRACLGKVNEAEFLGASAETLLFDGCEMEREWVVAVEGDAPQATWRLAYRFRERPAAAVGAGWNHAYRPEPEESAGWDRLVDVSGAPLYATADFAPLFQFG